MKQLFFGSLIVLLFSCSKKKSDSNPKPEPFKYTAVANFNNNASTSLIGAISYNPFTLSYNFNDSMFVKILLYKSPMTTGTYTINDFYPSLSVAFNKYINGSTVYYDVTNFTVTITEVSDRGIQGTFECDALKSTNGSIVMQIRNGTFSSPNKP